MNQNSNFLTGILSITQKGGMTLLRGANNDTTPLTELSELPTSWAQKAIQKTEDKKRTNGMPSSKSVVTVFKHVENFSASFTSQREVCPNRDIKKKPLNPTELLEAFVLDCIYDTFGSTRGVSFKFQSSDGQLTITKSF